MLYRSLNANLFKWANSPACAKSCLKKGCQSIGFIERNNNEIWGELLFKILKADFYLTFILKINLPIVKFSLYEPTRCKFCKIIEKVQSRLHREKYKINSRCISRPMHFPLNMSSWLIQASFLPSNWNLDKIFALTGELGQVYMEKNISNFPPCGNFQLSILKNKKVLILKRRFFRP